MKVYGSINTESNSEISTTPESPTISSNTLTIDCLKGNIFIVNHNANITTFNVTNPQDGQAIAIIFSEASSGLTITWPSNFFFLGSNVIDAVSGQINQVWAIYSASLSQWVVTLESNNGGAGTGTVTSVTVASTDLSVSGSPITTSGTITLNLNSNAVTNTKLAQMAAYTLKGNNTASTANASDLTTAQLLTMPAFVSIYNYSFCGGF